MTKKIILFLALFCALNSLGQASDSNPSSIDDLMDWLKTHVTSASDSTKLGVNSRRAILLSKQSNDQNTLAQSYRYLAIYHKEYSKLDSALYYFNKSKDIYIHQNNEQNLAETYVNLKQSIL